MFNIMMIHCLKFAYISLLTLFQLLLKLSLVVLLMTMKKTVSAELWLMTWDAGRTMRPWNRADGGDTDPWHHKNTGSEMQSGAEAELAESWLAGHMGSSYQQCGDASGSKCESGKRVQWRRKRAQRGEWACHATATTTPPPAKREREREWANERQYFRLQSWEWSEGAQRVMWPKGGSGNTVSKKVEISHKRPLIWICFTGLRLRKRKGCHIVWKLDIYLITEKNGRNAW